MIKITKTRYSLSLIPGGAGDWFEIFENNLKIGVIGVNISFSDYFDFCIIAEEYGTKCLEVWYTKYANLYKNKPTLAIPLSKQCERWLAKSKYFEKKILNLSAGKVDTYVLKQGLVNVCSD